MSRCIVLIRSHEPLEEGWRKRSFGPAGPLLEGRVKVLGVRFDEAYHPVQVRRRIGGGDDPPAASGFNYRGVGPAATYALRVEVDDQDAIERLRRDRQPDIVGVFADPVVTTFPSAYCGDAAIGASADVARGLGVPALRRAGLRGDGVHVAVVDTGIDGSRIPVAGGWAPTPGYVPGSSAPGHGTMVAYDVRIAAPDAQILDYALLTSQAGTWAAFLSDAIAAFAGLVERVNAELGVVRPRERRPDRLTGELQRQSRPSVQPDHGGTRRGGCGRLLRGGELWRRLPRWEVRHRRYRTRRLDPRRELSSRRVHRGRRHRHRPALGLLVAGARRALLPEA